MGTGWGRGELGDGNNSTGNQRKRSESGIRNVVGTHRVGGETGGGNPGE